MASAEDDGSKVFAKSHANDKAFMYDFPPERLGKLKYALYLPVLAQAYQVSIQHGVPITSTSHFHMLILVMLRYLMFQLWGTASRLPFIYKRRQIQIKPIKMEQVDFEASWENLILIATYAIWLAAAVLPHCVPLSGLAAWDTRGVILAFLIHIGPIEFLYYWAHRALHHHFLFTRYHSHHHSSFVTQPITSSNHPFLELIFYVALFGLGLAPPFLLGWGSKGLIYFSGLFVDFMNAWGHCNFELMSPWLFEICPPLKYILYSPTYHSLHHSKVHTNFALFMPFYDYIYGTMDETSDLLHETVWKGRENKVDIVYLSHPTELLSTFHLQLGFQTFAAKPYKPEWFMWLLWPFTLPILALSWLFAKPFAAAEHMMPHQGLQLETWMIPRYNFQYSLSSEKSRINQWVQDCICEAQAAGAKVIALGLLNKERVSSLPRSSLKEVMVPIVTGETLATSIVVNKISPDTKEVFLCGASSRIGQAIATYLCEKGIQVKAMLPSKQQYDILRAKIATGNKHNLIHVTKYQAGQDCKVWIVGEQLGTKDQHWAPEGAHFHQFTTFPIREHRRDCHYGLVPGLNLPDNAKTTNACEDVMPRYVVRACYAAAILHALEGWDHHDFEGEISISAVEECWAAAVKHGFSPV